VSESILYHITIMSLFSQDLDEIPGDIFWEYLQASLNINPFPDSSQPANSPVIGMTADLWIIVLKVSRLSHRLPLSARDIANVALLARQLQEWHIRLSETEHEIEAQLKDFDTNNADTLQCAKGARLYVVALQILTSKISNPHVSVLSTEIQGYLSEGIGILRSELTRRSCSQFFCWPSLVLGSAAVAMDHVSTMRDILDDMWERSHSGYVMKARHILEVIWDKTATNTFMYDLQAPNGKDYLEDGLDILIDLRWASDATVLDRKAR